MKNEKCISPVAVKRAQLKNWTISISSATWNLFTLWCCYRCWHVFLYLVCCPPDIWAWKLLRRRNTIKKDNKKYQSPVAHRIEISRNYTESIQSKRLFCWRYRSKIGNGNDSSEYYKRPIRPTKESKRGNRNESGTQTGTDDREYLSGYWFISEVPGDGCLCLENNVLTG